MRGAAGRIWESFRTSDRQSNAGPASEHGQDGARGGFDR
jgi:hypothetical protein